MRRSDPGILQHQIMLRASRCLLVRCRQMAVTRGDGLGSRAQADERATRSRSLPDRSQRHLKEARSGAKRSPQMLVAEVGQKAGSLRETESLGVSLL
jgi:hypothetical protein